MRVIRVWRDINKTIFFVQKKKNQTETKLKNDGEDDQQN